MLTNVRKLKEKSALLMVKLTSGWWERSDLGIETDQSRISETDIVEAGKNLELPCI